MNPKIDLKEIIEDFLRTATPEEMMNALREADPASVLDSFSYPVLDLQPKTVAFSFTSECPGLLTVGTLTHWGRYRSPVQRKWDSRLADLELAA